MSGSISPPPGGQPASYPSPHSYPSPSLQPAYTYPPPGDDNEPSPGNALPPNPYLSLPPIRSADGLPSSLHSQHSTDSPSSIPPSMISSGGAYYAPAVSPSLYNGSSPGGDSSPHMGMSYAMSHPQGTDPHMLSRSRDKKEIKRRTKTGCLTCRKRRIKCDEAHPICRNCQKSKRDCLGYDPIFKAQPPPPQIQPAPGVLTPSHPPPPAAIDPPHSFYANVPHGYAPATIDSASASMSSHYDYNSAIDPALASADPAALSSANAFDVPHSYPTGLKGALEVPDSYRADLKSAIDHASAYPASSANGSAKPKRTLKIEDLFLNGDDLAPPSQSKPVDAEMLQKIDSLFIKEYARGLDLFFETTWYSTEGLAALRQNAATCEIFRDYIEQIASIKSEDYDGLRKLPGREARLVWALMCLVRANIPHPDGSPAKELFHRLRAFELLITGHTDSASPLSWFSPPAGEARNVKSIEMEFWSLLGRFVGTPDPRGDSAELDRFLNAMRAVLQQLENRDVLYSMAVVRHVGNRINTAIHDGRFADDDDRRRVEIAKTFVEDEAAGKGTTQVIQRLCGMAARGWMATR